MSGVAENVLIEKNIQIVKYVKLQFLHGTSLEEVDGMCGDDGQYRAKASLRRRLPIPSVPVVRPSITWTIQSTQTRAACDDVEADDPAVVSPVVVVVVVVVEVTDDVDDRSGPVDDDDGRL